MGRVKLYIYTTAQNILYYGISRLNLRSNHLQFSTFNKNHNCGNKNSIKMI